MKKVPFSHSGSSKPQAKPPVKDAGKDTKKSSVKPMKKGGKY